MFLKGDLKSKERVRCKKQRARITSEMLPHEFFLRAARTLFEEIYSLLSRVFNEKKES